MAEEEGRGATTLSLTFEALLLGHAGISILPEPLVLLLQLGFDGLEEHARRESLGDSP